MTAHARPPEKSDVPFPKELIGSSAVIQGASGAGKTYAIRRILEPTHGRMHHIVFDVEDELFTLRQLRLCADRRVDRARYLSGLMEAPRPRLWHPVLVTLDEAHR